MLTHSRMLLFQFYLSPLAAILHLFPLTPTKSITHPSRSEQNVHPLFIRPYIEATIPTSQDQNHLKPPALHVCLSSYYLQHSFDWPPFWTSWFFVYLQYGSFKAVLRFSCWSIMYLCSGVFYVHVHLVSLLCSSSSRFYSRSLWSLFRALHAVGSLSVFQRLWFCFMHTGHWIYGCWDWVYIPRYLRP